MCHTLDYDRGRVLYYYTLMQDFWYAYHNAAFIHAGDTGLMIQINENDKILDI